jgi:hypothetical protein
MQLTLGDWANLATAVGAPLATIAAFAAVATLINTSRTARLQRMHDLFKDYLKLDIASVSDVDRESDNEQELRRKLASFKMYTLEEMTLWLKREKLWRWFYFWSKFYQAHIDSWQCTIDWHLAACSQDDFVQFDLARSCYGEDFCEAVDRVRDKIATARQLVMMSDGAERSG